MLTISWSLLSICYLMDNMEFVVRTNVFGRENPVHPSCVIRPGLIMEDLDATHEFKGDNIIALLSTYVDALLYNLSIIAVDIP